MDLSNEVIKLNANSGNFINEFTCLRMSCHKHSMSFIMSWLLYAWKQGFQIVNLTLNYWNWFIRKEGWSNEESLEKENKRLQAQWSQRKNR